MRFHKVKYVGHSRHSFQGDTPAEISRVLYVKRDDQTDWRLCLEVVYPDGAIDHVPLGEALQREFLVREDLVEEVRERDTVPRSA